jgi:phage-related protein
VASLPEKAATALASLAGRLKTAGLAGMAGLWNGLKDKWSDVIAWVQTIPTKVGNAFSGAATWLWSEGYSIISGLLGGIKAAWEAVASYLGTLAGKIKDLKGPLDKDRKLLVPEGRAIMAGLLDGILSGQPALDRALSGIGASIADTSMSAPMVLSGAGSGGTAVTINIGTVLARDPAEAQAASSAIAADVIRKLADARRSTRRGSGK